MSDNGSLAKTVTLMLGASVMLVISADTAAAVSTGSVAEALAVIREAAKNGKSSIGEARLDEHGRLRLAQFNDTWNKWSKEFSDAKPG